MNIYKPTWLYIKQHNVSGLKYFGKTTSKDPCKYLGSGVAWKQHLLEFGSNVSTLWFQKFNSREELEEYARNFSKENDIVNSLEWANLIPENGIGGGSKKGRLVSETRRQKLRGKKKSIEARQNISKGLKGRKKSTESAQKSAKSRTGLKRSEESRFLMSQKQKGRIITEDHKQKIKEAKNSPEGKLKIKEAWDKRRLNK